MSNRLSEIIQRLEHISLETTELTKELKELQQRDERDARRANTLSAQHRAIRTTQAPKRSELHNFKQGQAVEITNDYGDLKGTRGVITNATRTRVTIIDNAGRSHTRKFNNIKLS
jgi:chromosome segregation ATPase